MARGSGSTVTRVIGQFVLSRAAAAPRRWLPFVPAGMWRVIPRSRSGSNVACVTKRLRTGGHRVRARWGGAQELGHGDTALGQGAEARREPTFQNGDRRQRSPSVLP